MSRIFHRPMFRIGGSAGGITSGLRRGYADGEDVQISDELLGTPDYQGGTTTSDLINKEEVVKEQATPSSNEAGMSYRDLIEGLGDMEPPQAPGFDWGTFGLNLMSGPSEGDIWSDIGSAGKEPWARYKQGKQLYAQSKYKDKWAKKQFMLDAYSKLNSDEKIAIEKEIEFWMSSAGGKKSREEALELVMFRKPKNPKDVARENELRQQDELALELQNIRTGLGDKFTTLDDKDAMQIKRAKDFARENNLGFDLDASIIIDRSTWSNFKGAIGDDENITLTEKNVGNFTDGNVYVDIVTGNIYEKQGNNLIKRN